MFIGYTDYRLRSINEELCQETLNDKFEANTATAEVEGLAKAPASEEATAAHA